MIPRKEKEKKATRKIKTLKKCDERTLSHLF